MKVSWDDAIPNIWKVIKAMFQTTNQISFYWPSSAKGSSEISHPSSPSTPVEPTPRNDSEPIEETMTRQAAVGQLNRMTLPGR
jgi:hypothetical protein